MFTSDRQIVSQPVRQADAPIFQPYQAEYRVQTTNVLQNRPVDSHEAVVPICTVIKRVGTYCIRRKVM